MEGERENKGYERKNREGAWGLKRGRVSVSKNCCTDLFYKFELIIMFILRIAFRKSENTNHMDYIDKGIELILTIQYGMSVQFKYIPNVCALIFYDHDAIQYNNSTNVTKI